MNKVLDHSTQYGHAYKWELNKNIKVKDVIDIIAKDKLSGRLIISYPFLFIDHARIRYNNGIIVEGILMPELLDKEVTEIMSIEEYYNVDLDIKLKDVEGLYADMYKKSMVNLRKETTKLYNSLVNFEKEA